MKWRGPTIKEVVIFHAIMTGFIFLAVRFGLGAAVVSVIAVLLGQDVYRCSFSKFRRP